MTRFKNSLLSRILSRTLIASLLVASMPFSLFSQITATVPKWAVIDFVNNSSLGGDALGGAAADAVATNLAGYAKAEILGRETVDRAYKDLQFTPPLRRNLDIIKLGQHLDAEIVVVGEIKNARINHSANGKSADVILVVRGIDVVSNLAIYGTAVGGQSSERPGDVSDAALLNEAVEYAATVAVRNLMTQTVDVATVLTTPGDGRFVKLNKGARQGVKVGQTMVVTRGREKVAMLRVSDVDSDSSMGHVIEGLKGVAPGDRARVVYDQLPEVSWSKGGGTKVRTQKRMDAQGALLALLVVGATAALIGTGGGGNEPGEFTTEAGVAEDGVSPVVRCSWKPNIFNLGNANRVEWQVWRTDYTPTPIAVLPGSFTSVFHRLQGRLDSWRDISQLYGSECIDDPGAQQFDNPAPGISPGVTAWYQLSLIYRISALDNPNGGDQQYCYYTTTRMPAKGPATPLFPPALVSPPDQSKDVNNVLQFSWQPVAGANEYLVQISTEVTFRHKTKIKNIVVVEDTNNTDPIDISGVFPTVKRLYWRVGAKNLGDVPGPVRDVAGNRYVFSQPFWFERVTPPPPPPPL